MKRIFGIAILATLMACNQAEKKSVVSKDSTIKDSVAVNTVSLKNEKAGVIFAQYIDLKNALVKSDSAGVQKSASSLQTSLADYKGCEMTADVAKKISSVADLKSQRKDFTVLSADLIALFKNTDVSTGTIYVQHCPMANKGDGGDWLSTEKEIKNPYYGKNMLECGRVVEEIKAK
ncbi:DUF3347 domain-containing protein [Pedobacter fastidiosus]|uniref:DUF3347 domain-containing protein n=1 Tax=Pedobacter fastidiosus TaxID=2765361 RepID=A0ABR7KN62_9SPHI|nr:DUF3347 domain-containing protein [Pedobacter fastidiosus]MBC6109310.1 DUF3347 domain-containing protein [Pedobacter fastidiosus]